MHAFHLQRGGTESRIDFQPHSPACVRCKGPLLFPPRLSLARWKPPLDRVYQQAIITHLVRAGKSAPQQWELNFEHLVFVVYF